MKIKPWILAILQIQILILIALAIFGINRLDEISEKLFNTNKLLYSQRIDSGLQKISQLAANDITLGNKDAPISIIMYSKFDCPYCHEFFTSTFHELDSLYIQKNVLKFTIRFLSSSKSEDESLIKLAYLSHEQGNFNNFLKLVITDRLFSAGELADRLHLKLDETEINISQTSKEALAAGVHRTPSFIINGELFVGNRKMKLFDRKIKELLNHSNKSARPAILQ
ncbi:Thioredoxin [Reichenbachiella faecimaris]|uniref:Thioredoxin n=1 Tax=Reichenbachiella faecimaris TaxID=692418 RepID=A0A1W2GKB7_REIFA|nr:thioredoxin domain-containing protein [Reichenbachiella faecimaris]SMD36706.1 Thioredoxin [Reichenbachiella faecimaris]